MVFVVLLELVCHCRWLFKPTEKAELVAMSISERNYFIWLFSFSSESVHEKRNGKRKGKHPEAVTVVSMISPTECSFSSFFALSVLFATFNQTCKIKISYISGTSTFTAYPESSGFLFLMMTVFAVCSSTAFGLVTVSLSPLLYCFCFQCWLVMITVLLLL